MVLHIKNMVCSACIKVVKEQLTILGHKIKHIELGLVETNKPISKVKLEKFEQAVSAYGFELIENENEKLIKQVKSLVIERIYANNPEGMKINFSEHLSDKLHMNYGRLSKLFSALEQMTIEQFIIRSKIERVKELLSYDEISLNEISHRLNYSSLQHLSNQFKRITGVTTTAFKNDPKNRRIPLNKL